MSGGHGYVAHASAAAPGGRNEDLVVGGSGWVAVLDGATAPAGVDSGCRHDVRWLVARLGSALAARLCLDDGAPLPGLLAEAIAETREGHGGGCDLANPDSPSATVAVARAHGGVVDCLVLADSPVVVEHPGGGLTVIDDDRLSRLPGGRPYSLELVRASRNRAAGFWVAGADPLAADEALTATFDRAEVSAVGVFSDGVSRLVEHFGRSWPEVMAALRGEGPRHLIDEVRRAERERPLPYGKRHDDATAALLLPGTPPI